MTTSLMFVIMGILALVCLSYLWRGIRVKGVNLDELAAQLRPVDVNAFRNLIDEREEQFLRESLPWFDFRSIHRERMLAAVEYILGAAKNAGILIRLAEAAACDPDPTVVTAAQTLIHSATAVRVYALQEVPRFYMRILLPNLNAPHRLAEQFEAMTRQGVMLNRLKPAAYGLSGSN